MTEIRVLTISALRATANILPDATTIIHVLPISATAASANIFQIVVKDLHVMFMVNAFPAET